MRVARWRRARITDARHRRARDAATTPTTPTTRVMMSRVVTTRAVTRGRARGDARVVIRARGSRVVAAAAGRRIVARGASEPRPDVRELKMDAIRQYLVEMGLPVQGKKKAELAALLERAWAWSDEGTDPLAAHAEEVRVEEERAAAERASVDARREQRRARRGDVDDARSVRSRGSVVETTHRVAAMEDGVSEVKRDFIVQQFMSESGTGREGWFMVETAENREERAREMILALNGTKLTRDQPQPLVAWVPRVPKDDFYITEEDAAGKTPLELCQMIGEDDMVEMLQPGYVLVWCRLTQGLMDAFEGLWSVRGFATGGSSRFGKAKYEKVEQPLSMDDQIAGMLERCRPKTKSHEDVEADNARAQAQEVARAGRQEADEGDGADLRPEANRVASTDRIEVHAGPFKGFKGYIVTKNADGSIEAVLAIFGRDTNVSLSADEFKCI